LAERRSGWNRISDGRLFIGVSSLSLGTFTGHAN